MYKMCIHPMNNKYTDQSYLSGFKWTYPRHLPGRGAGRRCNVGGRRRVEAQCTQGQPPRGRGKESHHLGAFPCGLSFISHNNDPMRVVRMASPFHRQGPEAQRDGGIYSGPPSFKVEELRCQPKSV